MKMIFYRRAAAALVLGLSAISPPAIAQTFVPPPRSIADITAVLDSDKPDPTKLARYAAQADAQPPTGASGSTLAKFYRDRAVAASQVGRAEQWIADAKEALRLYNETHETSGQESMLIELGAAESQVGNFAASLDYARQRAAMSAYFAGAEISAHGGLAGALAFSGKMAEAQAELDQLPALLQRMRNSRRADRLSITISEANVAISTANVYEVQGRYADAERLYIEGIAKFDAVVQGYDNWMNERKPSRELMQFGLIGRRVRLAYTVAKQGRLAEAESIARQALLDALRLQGRYTPGTAGTVGALSNFILDEGRPDDAKRLAEAAVEIYQKIGRAHV